MSKHVKNELNCNNVLQLKEELGMLSSSIEYKIKKPNSNRKLITEKETFDRLRKIINLVNKL